MDTDVTIEAADVALMADILDHLPDIFAHARRTRRIVAQNLALSGAIRPLRNNGTGSGASETAFSPPRQARSPRSSRAATARGSRAASAAASMAPVEWRHDHAVGLEEGSQGIEMPFDGVGGLSGLNVPKRQGIGD